MRSPAAKKEKILGPDCWEDVTTDEWKRRNSSVEPGVYRTTEAIPVPGKPDGRVRRDWRNEEVPKGALVYVRQDREGNTNVTVYSGDLYPQSVGPGSAWFPALAEKLAHPKIDDMDGRFAALWFAVWPFDRPPHGSAASALKWLWFHSFIDDLALTRAIEGDADENGE